MSERVTIQTATLWLDSEDILYITVLAQADITLHDAQEIIATVKHIIAGHRKVVLADISGVKSVSQEARVYGTEVMKDTYLAVALITHSLIGRMIGNFFLKINKPTTPTQLFTHKEQAIIWLKGFQK